MRKAMSGRSAALSSGLLATVSVIALGFAFNVAVPTTVSAFECDNAAGGVSSGAPNDGANATNLACGSEAEAGTGGGGGNTALGRKADAGDASNTVNNIAVGRDSSAEGGESTAVGTFAEAGATDGTGDSQNTAIGYNTAAGTAGGGHNVAVGNDATAGDTSDTDSNTAIGDDAEANGGVATAMGRGATATGPDSTALGAFSDATQDDSTAVGAFAQATGTDSTAVGRSANAAAANSTSVGNQSRVSAASGTAVGDGAVVDVGHTSSTALGAGAATTTNNQMVYGTADETHSMPGITSATSKARQTGPLEIVTSDSEGNLATDGGALFSKVNQNTANIANNRRDIDLNREGVAISMALDNPDLVTDETFALSSNFAEFEGQDAWSFNAIGVVGRGLFGGNGRVAIAGGVGFSGGTTAGKVGAQISW